MTLIITVNLQMRVSAKVHAQLSNVHRTNSYLDEPHEINYWNSILGIHMNSCYYQLSGRKGSVKYGVGAEISFPSCLATGT